MYDELSLNEIYMHGWVHIWSRFIHLRLTELRFISNEIYGLGSYMHEI